MLRVWAPVDHPPRAAAHPTITTIAGPGVVDRDRGEWARRSGRGDAQAVDERIAPRAGAMPLQLVVGYELTGRLAVPYSRP
jgi:hypothetical protein